MRMHSFMHSFIHSSIHLFIHSYIHSFVLCTHKQTNAFYHIEPTFIHACALPARKCGLKCFNSLKTYNTDYFVSRFHGHLSLSYHTFDFSSSLFWMFLFPSISNPCLPPLFPLHILPFASFIFTFLLHYDPNWKNLVYFVRTSFHLFHLFILFFFSHALKYKKCR